MIRSLAIVLVAAVIATVSFVAPSTAQQSGLADRAPDGFNFGAVLHSYDGQWNRGSYSTVAANEFNAITATAYMPWGPVAFDLPPSTPADQVAIDTAPLDNIVQWAQQRDMLVHGHVLLYPAANASRPWWVSSEFDGKRTELARRYVETIAGSNPGGVDVWDVVNEVLADPYQLENNINVDQWGLRTDFVEYSEIGADYVDQAFRWADAVVDDDVQLIINDYGAETLNPKSDALFNYVLELRRRGVPIDGVGFQMHLSSLNLSNLDRTIASMEANLRRFANAGFDLYITELDIQSTENFTGQSPTEAQLRDQADMFQAITELALRVPRLDTLLMWDFADERSWLHPTDRVIGDIPIGSYTYPTPWFGGEGDNALTPKPAYGAIGTAFDQAQRPVQGPIDEQLLVRLSNSWNDQTTYLLRHGVANGRGGYDASSQANTHVLNETSQEWSSMWWSLEPTGDGYFRIRSQWEDQTGYLGRVGSRVGSRWVPERDVFLGALRPNGHYQHWKIEPTADGGYTLVNRWHPETGALTRSGRQLSPGQFQPLDGATLYPPAPWASQYWSLED